MLRTIRTLIPGIAIANANLVKKAGPNSVKVCQMENFLIRYGLFAVFAGCTVEADVIPILSGVLAHRGYFGFLGTVTACSGGMLLGDCFCYWLGRRFGNRIEKTAFYRRHLLKVERVIDRIGVWQILAARFIYGTRNATMLWWGMKTLNFATFVAIDSLGCLAWAGLLVSLGYFFSFSTNAIIGDVKRVEIGLFIIVVAGAASLFWKKYSKNKKIRDEVTEQK